MLAQGILVSGGKHDDISIAGEVQPLEEEIGRLGRDEARACGLMVDERLVEVRNPQRDGVVGPCDRQWVMEGPGRGGRSLDNVAVRGGCRRAVERESQVQRQRRSVPRSRMNAGVVGCGAIGVISCDNL